MTGTDLAALDFDRVLANLAEGAPTLTYDCKFDGAPRPWQVLAKAKADPEFDARLQDALIAGGDNVHTEMVAIEDGVVRGLVHPSAAAAALSSKRWRLERIDRKRWGAKVEVDANVKGEIVVQVVKLSEAG
jgi:hypothetical protein